MDTIFLTEKVRDNRCLYDMSSKQYRDVNVNRGAFAFFSSARKMCIAIAHNTPTDWQNDWNSQFCEWNGMEKVCTLKLLYTQCIARCCVEARCFSLNNTAMSRTTHALTELYTQNLDFYFSQICIRILFWTIHSTLHKPNKYFFIVKCSRFPQMEELSNNYLAW